MVETGKKLKTITWEECEKRINKEFMHDTDYDIFCGDYHGRELIRVHFFVHGAKYFRSVLKKRKKLRTITWEECGKRMDKAFTRNADYDMFWGRYHNKELIRVHFFLKKDKEETEDYVAKIELSAKGVQQEHGLSFKDACWVVDKIVESEETHTSLGFSEDHFVNEIKGENK